jgi:periplasmic divalent cation tolerance protein
MDQVVFLYVTAPDDEAASRIAGALVDARAAACVNILPRVRSVYRWNGAVERCEETGMIVKTTAARAGDARALIERLHPYDTPVIAALSIDAGNSGEKFVDWIKAAVLETLS